MSTAETSTEDRVVVGVDGSDDSIEALRVAARAGEVMNATLVVVTTWPQPPTFGRTPLRVPDFQRETAELQGAAIRGAFGDRPPARLLRVVRGGAPSAALVRESERARLVVVGRRGHGGFGSLLLGSTAMSTVVHSACSVLVLGQEVRAAPTSDVDGPGIRRVVVGVDWEAPSIHALAAADRAAALLEARLDVVTVWDTFDGDLDTMSDFRDAVGSVAQAQQDAAVEEVVPPARRKAVHRIIREGGVSAVLVDEAEHADLLVVGIRSRSALVEAFTGAIPLTTAGHADCPVLVVRATPDAHGTTSA
ncbi:MAG: universal stress protein UspA [Amnibacterium sp.]|nr:universal stress protein UspA [Amnibacterium sp.]